MRKGWTRKKLGDVCATIQDGAHESPPKQFDAPADGRFLYITSKNIRTNYLDLEDVTYVDQDFHNRIYPRCQPRVGDVLLTKDGANTGNVTLNTIEEPFSLLSSVCLIKTNPSELTPAFLCYYIQSPDGLRSLTGQMTGAAIKRIILRDIKLATIPVAPLSEQLRIVDVLDEAFKGIATVKANAEKNLQNAAALFASHLQSVFTQRGDAWKARRLGDVFDIGSSKRIYETEWTTSGVPFYGGREIVRLAKSGTAVSDAYISEEKYLDFAARYEMPRKGDIVMTARGTIGVGYVVKEEDRFYYKDGNIISLRAKVPTNPHFILYAFRSGVITDQLAELTGTTVRHLPIEKAKDLTVTVPDFDSQNSIVEQIRRVDTEVQRLESIYQEKLAAVEALRESLLHQAFTGQL